jgi:curved DNA-binding protein CbpA
MGESATYYDILRVGRQAAPASVRTAYRRLAQKYHPDKLPGNADAVRVMVMLNEAYGVLSDPDRRARYDRHIADECAYAKTARLRGITLVDAPAAAWPWYLLFVTIACAAAAVGTVVYKSVVPGVAVAVSVPAIQAEDSRQPRQSVVSSAARN